MDYTAQWRPTLRGSRTALKTTVHTQTAMDGASQSQVAEPHTVLVPLVLALTTALDTILGRLAELHAWGYPADWSWPAEAWATRTGQQLGSYRGAWRPRELKPQDREGLPLRGLARQRARQRRQ